MKELRGKSIKKKGGGVKQNIFLVLCFKMTSREIFLLTEVETENEFFKKQA